MLESALTSHTITRSSDCVVRGAVVRHLTPVLYFVTRSYHSDDPLDLGESLWLSHWCMGHGSSSSSSHAAAAAGGTEAVATPPAGTAATEMGSSTTCPASTAAGDLFGTLQLSSCSPLLCELMSHILLPCMETSTLCYAALSHMFTHSPMYGRCLRG